MIELQTVKQLMNLSPITVFPDTPLEGIKQIFQDLKVNYVVVVKLDPQGLLLPIGLIDKNNLIQLENNSLDYRSLIALDLVQNLDYSITSKTTLSKVEQTMNQLKLDCLVVIGNNGELLGTISKNDIILKPDRPVLTNYSNLILYSNRTFNTIIQTSVIVNSMFNYNLY